MEDIENNSRFKATAQHFKTIAMHGMLMNKKLVVNIKK